MRIEAVSVGACRLRPAVLWGDTTNKVQGLQFILVELPTDTGQNDTGIGYTVDVGGIDNGYPVEDVIGGSLTEFGLLAEPIQVEASVGTPPNRPGLGMVLDTPAVRVHALTPEVARHSFSGGSK
jgi:hypothetical protein